MSFEIERKFLVKDDSYKSLAQSKIEIKQGFLNSNPNRVVRVRITNDDAFLTIKGKSNDAGTTRFEWEQKIDVQHAKELMLLCEKGIIEKTRYQHFYKKHMVEIDEFFGENKGLVLAEIELDSEKESFEKPLYLGEEVTGNVDYYNSNLSKNPFTTWHKKTSN